MTFYIHPVVQDAADFDLLPFARTIEDQVTAAPTMPGDMKSTEARQNLVA